MNLILFLFDCFWGPRKSQQGSRKNLCSQLRSTLNLNDLKSENLKLYFSNKNYKVWNRYGGNKICLYVAYEFLKRYKIFTEWNCDRVYCTCIQKFSLIMQSFTWKCNEINENIHYSYTVMLLILWWVLYLITVIRILLKM